MIQICVWLQLGSFYLSAWAYSFYSVLSEDSSYILLLINNHLECGRTCCDGVLHDTVMMCCDGTL